MYIHNHATGGPGITPEATLFWQAQAGCRDCLNALMAHHDGLVQAVVRRQVLGDLPFTEALQAGRSGLWHAIPSTSSGQAWALTPHGAWLSPPTPDPALYTRSGGRSRPMPVSIRCL